MLRLSNLPLSAAAVSSLAEWQAAVDGQPDFPASVATAKKDFSAKNTATNRVFSEVRRTLAIMHGPLVRCAYCEDSLADEVEHIYPKDIFPGRVFRWDNYAYACGPCNGPKNNRFAVFLATDGSEVDVTPPKSRSRPKDWLPTPPPAGRSVLIDPRAEDPLDFLRIIDLPGTCLIAPLSGLSARDQRRAEYTCEVLSLNRDFLLRARRTATRFAIAAFRDYSVRTLAGEIHEAGENKAAILSMPHPMVWREMVRQRADFPVLQTLFQQHPEALLW